MTTLLFHPTTAKTLATFKNQLPHALLVSGAPGIGLMSAAKHLGANDIIELLSPQDNKGNPTPSGTISVELIRRLYEQTRSRPTARQVVIVHHAERMSPGASAAFLKLLEEPALHTHFILTSHQPQLLLPTIRSRTQHIELRPLTAQQTDQFIESLGVTADTKKTQLKFIAAGLPAELSRLVADDAYFQANAQVITDARDFLQGNLYAKLLVIQKYRQERVQTLQLTDASLAILHRSLTHTPQADIVRQIERLLEIRERIAAGGNASLQLAQFVV